MGGSSKKSPNKRRQYISIFYPPEGKDYKWYISGMFMYVSCQLGDYMLPTTPPKTNMEPENGPLEEEIPFRNHHFQVLC